MGRCGLLDDLPSYCVAFRFHRIGATGPRQTRPVLVPLYMHGPSPTARPLFHTHDGLGRTMTMWCSCPAAAIGIASMPPSSAPDAWPSAWSSCRSANGASSHCIPPRVISVPYTCETRVSPHGRSQTKQDRRRRVRCGRVLLFFGCVRLSGEHRGTRPAPRVTGACLFGCWDHCLDRDRLPYQDRSRHKVML